MNDASPRAALGLLASCVVHVGAVLGLHGHTQAREQATQRPLWLELHVEAREPGPDRAAAVTLSPSSSALPVEPPAATARRARPARAREGAAPPVSDPPAIDPPAVDPPAPVAVANESGTQPASERAPSVSVVGDAPGAAQPRPSLDLSPLATARALWDEPQVMGRDAGPRRTAGASASVPTNARPSGLSEEQELAGELPGLRSSTGRSAHGAIEDAAEEAIYSGLRPWKLLQRTMQGSAYRYTGSGFDAAILPDGRVRFRDKDGLRLTVFALKTIDGPTSNAQLPPAPVAGFSLGDPASLFSRLRGKDPYAAERRTFLERTRKLREYLAARAGQRGAQDDDASSEATELEPQVEPKVEPPVEPP